MDEDVRLSRLRVSRRRALQLGGTVSLAGLLAACSRDTSGPTRSPGTLASAPAADSASRADVLALLDRAGTCAMTPEQIEGPYWFDVDAIRSDLREDRPGRRLDLALRVQDVSACGAGGQAEPLPEAVVEVWHCDAGGLYSGFEVASGDAGGDLTGGVGSAGGAGAAGGPSDGAYTAGEQEATTTDDGTYLRGAQVADRDGLVRFTTVFPGWYPGRTAHVHLKVHRDKQTVLTSQLYFPDEVSDQVYALSPYSERGGRDTRNRRDGFFDPSGLMTVVPGRDLDLAVVNLGVEA